MSFLNWSQEAFDEAWFMALDVMVSDYLQNRITMSRQVAFDVHVEKMAMQADRNMKNPPED